MSYFNYDACICLHALPFGTSYQSLGNLATIMAVTFVVAVISDGHVYQKFTHNKHVLSGSSRVLEELHTDSPFDASAKCLYSLLLKSCMGCSTRILISNMFLPIQQ